METLPLDLDIHSASSLFIILDAGKDALAYKKTVLEKLKLMPEVHRDPPLDDEQLAGVIKLNQDLLAQAEVFSKEVTQIILELEKPPQKLKIIKPNFG